MRLPDIDANQPSQAVLHGAGLLPEQPSNPKAGKNAQRDAVGAHTAAGEIEFCKISEAIRRFGISRSGIYDLASDGLITLRKTGVRAVVVDVASLRAYMASCPTSNIRSRKSAVS